MNSDGTGGLVEVLGQPCGPEAPNVPLAFTLTPMSPEQAALYTDAKDKSKAHN